jgi:hypothetical protein
VSLALAESCFREGADEKARDVIVGVKGWLLVLRGDVQHLAQM